MSSLEAPIISQEQASERLAAGAPEGGRAGAWEVLRRAHAEALASLMRRLERADEHRLERVGWIRRTRIMARRLEVVSEVAHGAVGKKVFERSRRLARGVRRALGPIRSCDAVLSLLREREVGDAGAQGFVAGLLMTERPAMADLALGSLVGLRVKAEKLGPLVGPIVGPIEGGSCRALLADVAADVRETAKRARLDDVDTLHKVRIRIKRARFLCEWLSATTDAPRLAPVYAWLYTAQRRFGALSDAADVVRATEPIELRGEWGESVDELSRVWSRELAESALTTWDWWQRHSALVLGSLKRPSESDDGVLDAIDEMMAPPPAERPAQGRAKRA